MLRQWAGMADMTPDFSPVMGLTPVRELLHRRRLGHLGLQGDAGLRQAHGRMRRHRPRSRTYLKPFALDRFERFDLVGEKGAASVGH